MWGLSSFPLNPGRPVSISTNRVQWKWRCVTSGWVTLSKLPVGIQSTCLKSQRPRGGPGARAQPPSEQPLYQGPPLRLKGNLCFWIQTMTFLWLKAIIGPVTPFPAAISEHYPNDLLKSCKEAKQVSSRSLCLHSNCFRYTAGKTNSLFQKKNKTKCKCSSQQSQMVLVFMTSQPKHHTCEWGNPETTGQAVLTKFQIHEHSNTVVV